MLPMRGERTSEQRRQTSEDRATKPIDAGGWVLQNVQACVLPWQNPTQKATVSFTSSSMHSCQKNYKLYKIAQNIDVKYSKMLFLQLPTLFATMPQCLPHLHRLRPRPRVLPLHVQPAGTSNFFTQLWYNIRSESKQGHRGYQSSSQLCVACNQTEYLSQQ